MSFKSHKYTHKTEVVYFTNTATIYFLFLLRFLIVRFLIQDKLCHTHLHNSYLY